MSTINQQPPQKKTRRRKFLLMLLVAFFVLLLASSGSIFWLYFGSSLSFRNSGRSFSAALQTTEQVEAQVGVRHVANRYMNALLSHDYATMWSLLDPQIQQSWGNETAFAGFWNRRFQEYTLQGFSLGQPGKLANWTNPESMLSYRNVALIPISLQLQLKHPSTQTAQLPELRNPSQLYQNLPFIVQQVPATQTQQGSTQWAVLAGGPADLEAPILPPTTREINTTKVPILMYHHISNVVPDNYLLQSLTVHTNNFIRQLDYLKQHSYHTITFNQLFNALYYGAPLPQHPIMLTFDDGYEDSYSVALPQLLKHGFSGTFYIISGHVGWTGYMHWEELQRLLDTGMQIGSHTVNHVDMGQLTLYDPTLAQKELVDSKATLEKHLGRTIQQFCYPSGEPFRHGTLELQQEVVNMLTKDGYIGATTDPGQTGYVQSSEAPFALLRIRMDGRDPALVFTTLLP